MHTLFINKKFLWFPVKRGGVEKQISLFLNQKKQQEIKIETADEGLDFYVFLKVEQYIGRELTIEGDFSDKWLKQSRQEDGIPVYPEGERPHIHYAPTVGWLNDPNGMIFYNGKYHLFHQHNPYGTKWCNIHWSHTSSEDLTHWSKDEIALHPDETGLVYSGSAIIDKENVVGYGRDALLFYYTAAAGHNQWSGERVEFTQRMAYSTNEAETLVRSDRFMMECMDSENRDPKVFYHTPTKGYIMLLYAGNNLFFIFRSLDLLNWERTQELYQKKFRECPDLFEIFDEAGNSSWCFTSADGYYLLGSFDGYRFTPDTGVLKRYAADPEGYNGARGYAAQTYVNCGQRVISQSWIMYPDHHKCYQGVMSLPAEVTLIHTREGERAAFYPAKELECLRQKKLSYSAVQEAAILCEFNQEAAEIRIGYAARQQGVHEIVLLGISMIVDFDNGVIRLGEKSVPFYPDERLDFTIMTDVDVFEIYINRGIWNIIEENKTNSLEGSLMIKGFGPTVQYIEIYKLDRLSN